MYGRKVPSQDGYTYRLPPSATVYDVDTEHAYIMAKALHSYQVYKSQEEETDNVSDPDLERLLPKRPRAQSATCQLLPGTRAPPQTPIKFLRSSNLMAKSKAKNHKIGLAGLGAKVYSESAIAKVGRANSTCSASSESSPIQWVRRVACCPRGRPTSSAGRGRTVLPASKVVLGDSSYMDKIGTSREYENIRRNMKFEGTFFQTTRSPRKQYFTIHPEWVSENLNVQKMTLQEKCNTYPPRRCKSAPPANTRCRNPITWENWTVTPYR